MDSFIQYRNYGLGETNNLLLSYIAGWGDKGTYASNEYISNQIGMGVRTIMRTLKTLKGKDLITITNPKGRNRHIRIKNQPRQSDAHNHDNLTQYVRQNDLEQRQNVAQLDTNKNNNKIELLDTNNNTRTYNSSSGKISQEEYNAFYDYYKKSGYSDEKIKEILK